MSEYSSLAAVERTFIIIKALVGKVNGLSVSKLVEETGLSKSIVSRILKTLTNNNYVEQDDETRFYRLSLDFIGLSLKHFNTLGIDGVFSPALKKISQEVQELVQLAVVQNRNVYFVHKIEGNKQLKVADMLGKQAPLNSTAAGKLWLSSLPKSEIISLISNQEMKKYTENTITNIDELLDELQNIRDLGYAVSNEEFNQGVIGVAVPIYSNDNSLIATIVITVPTVRMPKDRIQEIVSICKKYIATLDQQLPLPH
ncbi:IclR family transcriptional regulator [Alteribacillus sp. YIM 98480]|uniref:IclR family transcriptional regulator n=1 Tax=Alteribacillus sp. YIM 98480 TaxID=2606599 RepID=UPI00131D008A|nr:IclR family transcriptional regulator [Alteribacillus sp. YIM 98480]